MGNPMNLFGGLLGKSKSKVVTKSINWGKIRRKKGDKQVCQILLAIHSFPNDTPHES